MEMSSYSKRNLFSKVMSLTAATAIVAVTSLEAHAALLVSSRLSDEVKAYTEEGEFIKNFITAGSGGLFHPDGFAFGADGDFYLSSTFNGKLLRYNGQTGDFKDVFVDTGEGGLLAPVDMILGQDPTILYVANFASSPTIPDYTPTNNDSILAYNTETGDLVQSLDFPLGSEGPLGLAFDPNDNNSLLVSTFGAGIWRFNIQTGTGENFIPFGEGGLRSGGGMAFNEENRLLVTDFSFDPTDTSPQRILSYDANTGAFIEELVSDVSSNNVNTPLQMIIGPDGELIVNGSFSNNVVTYDSVTGEFLGTLVESGAGGLNGTNFGLAFADIEETVPESVPEPSSKMGLLLLGTVLIGSGLSKFTKK